MDIQYTKYVNTPQTTRKHDILNKEPKTSKSSNKTWKHNEFKYQSHTYLYIQMEL